MSASSLSELPGARQDCLARTSNGASSWSQIARRTVYFGHQSVGSGIVAGVEQLTRDHGLPLRVIQTPEPASIPGPAFVHFLVGQKRDYASKNAAVLRLLESSTRADKPLVMLKYCYGDIRSPDESGRMFEAYRDTVDTIQSEHPDVTVVHATIPLTTAESSFQSAAKRLFGRSTQREASVARHRYNELVRREFRETEPIFDLAKVQSTRPDGTMAGFTVGGHVIEKLAPENTADGIHLTPQCQRVAAEALLDVLADAIEVRV